MSLLQRPSLALLSLIAVVSVGWVDYITGPGIAFSLFYLIPIVIIAWYVGRFHALLAALSATICWCASEYIMYTHLDLAVAAWNAFSRLVIFGASAWLVDLLHRDRIRLRALIDRESTLARTDELTGLLNRRAFDDRLATQLARSQRDRTPICVMFFDLDNFKRVNDVFGHESGDTVLKNVAHMLHVTMRATDIAGRLGGDEFAALLWHVEPEDATKVGERIVERVKAMSKDYPDCELGVSVGIAYFDDLPAHLQELTQQADRLMYIAKSQGKNQFVFWKSSNPSDVISSNAS